MSNNELIKCVLNAGSKIHKTLGPGLLKEVYLECMIYELSKSGIIVEQHKQMPLRYESLQFDNAYKVDLWIENYMIIGIKPDHTSDILFHKYIETHVKLSGLYIGMALDFNRDDFRSGAKVIEKKISRPVAPPIMFTEDYYYRKKY